MNLKYVDMRMLPFLNRHMGSGSDAALEALCTISCRIDGPEIDPTLAGLFHRWSERFDNKRIRAQHHGDNRAFWGALGRLAGHPRFRLIAGYANRLMTIVYLPIDELHKAAIVHILEGCPQAYTQIESLLFRAAPFEIYPQDEVDRLDDAADKLFSQLSADESSHPLSSGAHDPTIMSQG